MPKTATRPAGKLRKRRRKLSAACIPFQFKPGQSGNPEGRRREKPIAGAMRLASHAVFTAPFLRALGVRLPKSVKSIKGSDLIALGQIASAGKGKTEAAREIADRLDGKVPQGVYASDEDGNATAEQLAARVAELMARGRARAAKG